jgi:hypothetical protein
MTTALEERVDQLEHRVEQLETWAGPGQNEGFSANLVEIRKSLAALSDGQAVLRDMLVENTRILGGHTEILTGHTQTLDQHTEILTGHGDTLDNHTDLLNEILLRLPSRPEQPGEQSSRMQ